MPVVFPFCGQKLLKMLKSHMSSHTTYTKLKTQCGRREEESICQQDGGGRKQKSAGRCEDKNILGGLFLFVYFFPYQWNKIQILYWFNFFCNYIIRLTKESQKQSLILFSFLKNTNYEVSWNPCSSIKVKFLFLWSREL